MDLTRCPACLATSADPDWCDQCGASLAPDERPWLAAGDVLDFPPPTPPPEPEPLQRPDITLVGLAPTQHAATRQFAAIPDRDPTPVRVTLVEPLDIDWSSRTWLARTPDGTPWRVAQIRGTLPVDGSPPNDVARCLDLPASRIDRQDTLLLLPHVHGHRLDERIEAAAGRPTTGDLRRWFLPLLDAVERCHRDGWAIVQLASDRVRLLDHEQILLERIHRLHRSGGGLRGVCVAPGFAAPELLDGDTEPVATPAVDLFAIGQILWHAVAGAEPPVGVLSAWAPAIEAREKNPAFPIGLAEVLRTATHPDPERRHPDIAALRADLVAALAAIDARDRLEPAPLPIHVAGETHVGITKRLRQPENQDALLCLASPDQRTALLVVADGVSTASFGNGTIASSLARRTFEHAWHRLPADLHEPAEREAWLRQAAQHANDEIIRWINDHHAPFAGDPHEVMGSTLVAALVHDRCASVLSIGDSPAFVVGPDTYERLNREHNVRTMSIAHGDPVDDVFAFEHADALTHCLGLFDIDTRGTLVARPIEADVQHVTLHEDEDLVLCSDGVTDYIADDPIEAELRVVEAVREEVVPELACLRLLLLAARGGGGDNATAAIARVRREPLNIFAHLGHDVL